MKIICYWLTLCFSENISKLLNGFHSSIYRQQMKYVVVLFWKKKKFNLCFLTWHQLILSPFPMGTLLWLTQTTGASVLVPITDPQTSDG